MGAEPGIGVLIDKDRLRSGIADERNNPYFIQLDDGRVYGSSPAQAVKLAARDDTRRVKGGPGVAIMIDKSRIASNNPSKRDNPYFIQFDDGRVYSSSPDEVMMAAADPTRSIFSKNKTALEKVAGAAAAGTAIGKGAVTRNAISSGFKSVRATLAAYSQKKTPAAAAVTAQVTPAKAAVQGANAARTAAVVREAELTAKPKLIRQANGTMKLFTPVPVGQKGGRTYKKRKLQKRVRVSFKHH